MEYGIFLSKHVLSIPVQHIITNSLPSTTNFVFL